MATSSTASTGTTRSPKLRWTEGRSARRSTRPPACRWSSCGWWGLSLQLVAAALENGEPRIARERRIGHRALAHPEGGATARDFPRGLAGRTEPDFHDALRPAARPAP